MHPVLIASAFAVLAGTAQAQSLMGRDGILLTGADARALCAAHGGLPLSRQASPAASTPSTPSLWAAQAGVVLCGGKRA